MRKRLELNETEGITPKEKLCSQLSGLEIIAKECKISVLARLLKTGYRGMESLTLPGREWKFQTKS